MVFIHGGGYVFDCAKMYPGGAIVEASRQMGVFGFLGSSELAAPGGGTGNYGIQDQRQAMRW
eukprot:gene3796-8507_t